MVSICVDDIRMVYSWQLTASAIHPEESEDTHFIQNTLETDRTVNTALVSFLHLTSVGLYFVSLILKIIIWKVIDANRKNLNDV